MHLTTFACHTGSYRFIRLSFNIVPVGGMFQQKIDEIFPELPNLFGFEDDILIVPFNDDGREHNRTLRQVMEVCQ